MRVKLTVLTVTLASVFAVSSLEAQVTGATVVGKVMDSAGSAISSEHVTVLRPSTGTHVEVTTNDSGVYTVPNLVPETYNIAAAAATLASQEIQGLTLEVGQNVEENFTLSPATVVQEVVITTTLPE